nr:DUF535 family protein [Paracoccus amoyensis]
MSTTDLLRRAMPKIAGPGNLKLRLRVWLAALANRRQFSALAGDPSPSLQMMARERPAVLAGPLVWPYLCAGWDADERLKRIQAHYRIVDRLGAPFPFSADERLVLADLDATYPGLRIVLDQPKWFMREGGLTLNLFVDDFRAYSLAFSFSDSADGQETTEQGSGGPESGGQGIDCLIGAIQGRNTDEAADLYRDLTKAAHGLRPRDFLIEMCRILCRHWNVRTLLAVRDSERHHRHPFFGGKKIAPQDYDAIWQDRGGALAGPHFYHLPIESERRDENDIKPNKRSLYRRRYKFLDGLEAEIFQTLPKLAPVRFADR